MYTDKVCRGMFGRLPDQDEDVRVFSERLELRRTSMIGVAVYDGFRDGLGNQGRRLTRYGFGQGVDRDPLAFESRRQIVRRRSRDGGSAQ